MPSKDQWRYQIHVHPVDVNLDSRNESEYLVQLGHWGTRRQAATEGVAAAAALAAQKSDYLALQYSRKALKDSTDWLVSYQSESLAMQPEHTEVLIHISLEIN